MSRLTFGKDTQSGSNLSFVPNKDVNDGLCVGKLVDIYFSSPVYKNDSTYLNFIGTDVKNTTINFVFQGIPKVEGEKVPQLIDSFSPVDTGSISEEDSIKRIEWQLQRLKHFYDVLVGKTLKSSEAELSEEILFADSPNGDEILQEFKRFYTKIYSLFVQESKQPTTEGEEPKVVKMPLYYRDKLYLKLLVYDGRISFTPWVGEGLIERLVKGIKPKLRIRVEAGESIDLVAKKKDVRDPLDSAPNGPGASAAEASFFHEG